MTEAIAFDALPLLAAAAHETRARLEAAARRVAAGPGDTLFAPFETTDALWLLVEGRWRVWRRVAGREHEMFEADRPGTWTGGIPVIDRIAPPRAEVLAPSRFLAIPVAAVEDAVATSPLVAKRLLEAVHWGAGHIGGLIPEPDA